MNTTNAVETRWCSIEETHAGHHWNTTMPVSGGAYSITYYCPGRHLSESPETLLYMALELEARLAMRDPADPRRLAVAVTAWELAGYWRDWLAADHPESRDAGYLAIKDALYRRNKRLLKAEAKGLLRGLRGMIEARVIQQTRIYEAKFPARD